MLSNAIWFYKKPQDSTARVKRKLILLSLCVPLLWERGRLTYPSLVYFALHIMIKHFKYFRIEPVTLHSPKYLTPSWHWGSHTGWAAHVGHLYHLSIQQTCHCHPCDHHSILTCPSKALGHRVRLHCAKGSHRPLEKSSLKKCWWHSAAQVWSWINPAGVTSVFMVLPALEGKPLFSSH